MKNPNQKKRKLIILTSFCLLVILPIIIVLAGNKKKINESSRPVDRTNIPVAVSVAAAEIAPLKTKDQYPATIEPLDQVMIYAQNSGMIANLDLYLGRQLHKGQIIGRLDTRILEINLKNAQIDRNLAAINKIKKLDDYNRAKDLFENNAGLQVNMLSAKNEYDNAVNKLENSEIQIRLIQQQIRNSVIISPLNGTISAHMIKQGEFVNPGSPIATISNTATVKATVFVDQLISYKLKTGASAVITSPLFGEQTFNGKINYISSVSDSNHNYQIDLLISEKKGIQLKGGTDVQVSFNTISKKEALLIPKSSLINDNKDPYVFIDSNGKARTKIVKTGIIQDDLVEVISGLNEGDRVITSGQINLSEGSNINIIK
ncbi:efflux RND transporter periplasmic adaptor subunit [Flavobacterium bizetiae]|mgnify:CR=1 FL=1|uniref:efflux RND transporter periplasmic adaptor subunit n=1 Tax=Flavobacterium bizetiae TaxID=2704140 RepID=UPI003756848F